MLREAATPGRVAVAAVLALVALDAAIVVGLWIAVRELIAW